MKNRENKVVTTASDLNQAIKDGYKYALQMDDPSDVWVSQEMEEDDLFDIYDFYYEKPSDSHIGCPINEAIQLFELK